MPLNFNEGLSVFNETYFTGFGRSRSTYHKMMMRSAVLADNIFPIDKWVTYEMAQFPRGETPYFYGNMFDEFLADKYGTRKLPQYENWYSGGIPLFLNTQAKRVYGKSFYSLWRDFKNEMTYQYQSEIAKIKEHPITQTTQLTFEGNYTESPLFSKDNNEIFYVSQNSDEYPSLKVRDLTTHKTRTLLRKPISSAIRLSPDGTKLIFSIRDIYKNYYTYDDIYIYDIAEKKLSRITKGLRATDPDFSPIENKIVFVKNELGQTNLCIMDLDLNKITQLTYSDDYTQYSCPRFSNDGKRISVAVWKTGGEQDIYIYDLVTDWILPVTQDKALDIQPCWIKNDEYLLFSSDRSNVFNIYAYQLKNHKLYKITNVLTGAFEPALSLDNKKLAFLQYSSKGYDVHMMDFVIDTLTEYVIASDSEVISNNQEYSKSESIETNLYHYNPFPSILPKFWLPLVSYDNSWSIGGITYGADALFQHKYLVQGLYDLQDKKPTIYLDYTLDRFYPTIDISGFYDKGKIQGNLSGIITFRKAARYQDLSLGYLINKDNYLLSGLGFSYGFSNAKIYPYSISPEQGRSVLLTIYNYDKFLLSKYNLTKLNINANEYLNLPFKHHILYLNLQTGLAFGDSIRKNEYSLGGIDEQFSIRGYTGDVINAQHLLTLTAEYRFPLFWIERGLGTMPVFFRNFSGKVFFDYGKVLSPLSVISHPPSTILGAGAEISLNMLLFYEVPATLTFGVASDLKTISKPHFSLQLSSQIPFVGDRKIFKE
jgi:Tol biopolymer transport system component